MKGYREEFQEVTTRDRGLSHVAGVQARLGNIAEAMNTVELIRWGPLQAEALFLIGKSCADSGDFVSAREKFASAFVRWVESYSRSSSVFLGKLALEQAKVGDFEGALTTTRCHELPSVRAILFAGISTVLGHTRGWEASLAVWEEADKAVNLVNDVGLRIQILLEIALDQVSTGGKDAAQTTFLTARNLAETASNLKLSIHHLVRIAAAQAKAGINEQAHLTLGEARRLAERIGEVEEVRSVAMELAENGFNDDAIEACHVGCPKEWLWIAAVFVRKGDLESFKRMLFSGSYDVATVGKTCILLAQAYPDKAEAIADVLFNQCG